MNVKYNAIGAYVIAEPILEGAYDSVARVSRATLLSFDATPHDDASGTASEALRMLAAVYDSTDVDMIIIYQRDRAIALSPDRVSIPADAIVAIELTAGLNDQTSVKKRWVTPADERVTALRDAEAMLRRVAERYEGGQMLEAADRVGAMAAAAEAETNRS